jgi:hypothetical protein
VPPKRSVALIALLLTHQTMEKVHQVNGLMTIYGSDVG